MNKIFNILGFQIGWWVCALGAKNDLDYLGPIYMISFIIVHLIFFSEKKLEIILIISGIILGFFVDSSFKFLSILSYVPLDSSFLAPLWIIAMWAGFCATLNHSLSWLKGNNIISFLMGAIFGPLSYLAGQKMGIIYFLVSPFYALTILAIAWGISIPFLLWINNQLDSLSR